MNADPFARLPGTEALVSRLPRPALRWIPVLLALVLALAAAGALGWLAWRSTWDAAERELIRGADAGAASASRILESHRLAAELINEMLRDLPDAEIRAREAELQERIAALVGRLPLLRGAVVVDREGRVLVAARPFPVPPGTEYASREWFRTLAAPGAPALFVGAVEASMVDRRPVFSVSRRRGGSHGLPPETFNGAISVAVPPDAVASTFAEIAAGSSDTITLVRADGRMLSRTPPLTTPLPDVSESSPLRLAMEQGQLRGTYMGAPLIRSAGSGEGPRLIAFRKVEGLPLVVTVARPVSEIASEWRSTMLLSLAIALPTLLALAALAWLTRRTFRAAEAARQALQHEAERRAAAEAARAQAEARRQAEARFRGVFESRVVGMAVYDLQANAIALANDRLLEMTGRRRDAEGRLDWLAATPSEWHGADQAAIAEAHRRGWWAPYEKELLRPDGQRVPVRVSSAPLPGERGRVVVMVQDISEQREAEARRDLLLREVDHRAKNALATARAALRLTRAQSLEEFIDVVDGRIGALAQAMAVLAATGWRGAELCALLKSELDLFATPGGPRVELRGPRLEIAARAVQPLAMAVHELATNAAKYGALSVREGLVMLEWRVEGEWLLLCWREAGGPAVTAPPEATGFGSRLLAATVGRQLGGSFSARWPQEGLDLVLRLPASLVLGESRARA